MKDSEYCFRDWQRESSIIARGSHGMTHGSRPKRPNLSLKGDSGDMVIRREGREIVIPAAWMTQAGTVRKSHQLDYEALIHGQRFVVYRA
jgi:hypothetical protein